MARGGKREAKDGKKIGRPRKATVKLSATKGLASTVLQSIPEHDYWRALLRTDIPLKELCLLDIGEKRLIKETMQYITDRRDGKPAQGVFVGDTRETVSDVNFGDLPRLVQPGTTGKPN